MSRIRLAAVVVALAFACDAGAHTTPGQVARDVGFTQRLGTELPGALAFHDDTGRAVRLGDYFGGAPIVLAFAWFGCTTLCPTVVRTLGQTLARTGVPADGYRVLVASIDPRDAASDAQRMKAHAGADAAAWHFLTGRGDAIDALTHAAGFRYAYDDETHQYAHPVGMLLLTPAGRVSRYFLGFDFTPADFARALQQAANDAVASPIDRLALLCFHFAPTGRYGSLVMTSLRIASGALLVLALGVVLIRRRRSRPPQAPNRAEARRDRNRAMTTR